MAVSFDSWLDVVLLHLAKHVFELLAVCLRTNQHLQLFVVVPHFLRRGIELLYSLRNFRCLSHLLTYLLLHADQVESL